MRGIASHLIASHLIASHLIASQVSILLAALTPQSPMLDTKVTSMQKWQTCLLTKYSIRQME
jgi:hypothetical protein